MGIDINRYWYDQSFHLITFVLLPFSWLFRFISHLRRRLYRAGIFKSVRFSVPVIVVGNITVGGTGKTPFVIWLAHYLRELGYQPGIVTRGFGGNKQIKPLCVNASSAVTEVGDEAILLVTKSGCPVVVGVDRVAAVRELLKNSPCDIVISDDGLQHYSLRRDIEIAIVDAARRFGNNHFLPAGPLRESVSRLSEVDFVVYNGGGDADQFTMTLQFEKLTNIKNSNQTSTLEDFPIKKIHAVAAVGNPGRFFNVLKSAKFDISEHVFRDHYLYQAKDLQFNDSLPIVMTEKDAVKCLSFADDRYWYLPVTVKMNEIFQEELSAKLKLMEHKNDTENDFTKHTCRDNTIVQCDSAGKSD